VKRWRELVRSGFERLGYTVHRWPPNRFDGMADALRLLRRAGYTPRVVVDGGANVGRWTRMARRIFPDAAFHLIEPQSSCQRPLEELARRAAGVTFHPVALTEPGVARVRMLGGGEGDSGTGAWVARPGEEAPGEFHCEATTLDALLASRLARTDRTLLKLDLEGHELDALRGGTRVLEAVEVVLTELQFFEINDNGRPVFGDVVRYFRDRGFELYDFACLSPRPRDTRLRMGDAIFVRRDSVLLGDRSWT
jgi:FkbM family methyltransferase